MPPPAPRARLSEEQILRMTDAILERRRRPRRRPWRVALAGSLAGALAIAVFLLTRTSGADLVPLALSAPGLLVQAALSDQMVLDRETVQRLMLHELESRGSRLESPQTQLVPPDRIVLSGRGPGGPVRVELRAIPSPDGRWLVGVSGVPGTQGETRVDPSSRLPAGHVVRRAVVEPERVVVELGS